jgi:hypothetical protein
VRHGGLCGFAIGAVCLRTVALFWKPLSVVLRWDGKNDVSALQQKDSLRQQQRINETDASHQPKQLPKVPDDEIITTVLV